MRLSSTSDKLRMTVWVLLGKSLFVAAVLGASLIPGINVLGALLIVSASVVLYSVLVIWVPSAEQAGGRRRGMPGQSGGDRFPRSPLPSGPSMAAQRRLSN